MHTPAVRYVRRSHLIGVGVGWTVAVYDVVGSVVVTRPLQTCFPNGQSSAEPAPLLKTIRKK